MKAMLAALVLAVGLAGCATAPPPKEKVVYKFVAVPKEMTQKCSLPMPPKPEDYSIMPWEQQEALLFSLLQNHTASIGTCNARIEGIDKWSDKQRQIYETSEPAAK